LSNPAKLLNFIQIRERREAKGKVMGRLLTATILITNKCTAEEDRGPQAGSVRYDRVQTRAGSGGIASAPGFDIE
jgi:hypothetical protein